MFSRSEIGVDKSVAGRSLIHVNPRQVNERGPFRPSWRVCKAKFLHIITMDEKLVSSGERDRLKELLRTRLVECGWRDELRAHCKEVLKERDVETTTVDDLVAAVTPKGRASVPDSIKRELLHQIRNFLSNQQEDSS
ncbi:putative transcription factor E(Y)2 [Ixodes scapularis]